MGDNRKEVILGLGIFLREWVCPGFEDIDGDGHINSEDAYPRDSTRHSSQTELEKILENQTVWILAICIIVIGAIYVVAKKRK